MAPRGRGLAKVCSVSPGRPSLMELGLAGLLTRCVRARAEAEAVLAMGASHGVVAPEAQPGPGRKPETKTGSIGWTEGEGGTRPLGWVVSPGFMAGLVLLKVWGLEASAPTLLVPSRGLSFPSRPVGPVPSQPWPWGPLQAGIAAGWTSAAGVGGLSSGWAPSPGTCGGRCLGGEWSLGPRPRCLPALKRGAPPPAPSGLKLPLSIPAFSAQAFLSDISTWQPVCHLGTGGP